MTSTRPSVRRRNAAWLALFVALAFPVAGAEASTQTQAFTVTGEHAFVVPAAVTSLHVTLAGGTGGAGVSTGATPAVGGFGATVSASLVVTPGQTIYAEVAGNGRIATPSDNGAGYGGGGGGGPVAVLLAGGPGGGGGGGASDVRACPLAANPAACSTVGSRFVVAAGGGGGGGAGLDKLPVITGGVGGAAGLAGASGAQDSLSDLGGGGGGAANQTGGGSAGINSYETHAAAGQLARGGNGGNSITGGGGGGGGGLFGGGGGGGGNATADFYTPKFSGGGGGGGGGGTSGVPAEATGVTDFALQANGSVAGPSVTFSWAAPTPTVTTGAATAVAGTSATMTGTVAPNGYQITDCHFVLTPAPATGSTVPCAQQLGAGTAAQPVTAAAAGLNPETTYTATLVAGGEPGVTTGQPVSFGTLAAGAAAASRTGAPLVSGLKLSRRRFHRGTRRATVTRRGISGTTISFGLSEAAPVRLTFERATVGRLAESRCVRFARAPKRGRLCTMYTSVAGSVQWAGHAGAGRVRFEGVLDNGRPLRAGSYRLTLVAVGAGGAASPAQRAVFTIVP